MPKKSIKPSYIFFCCTCVYYQPFSAANPQIRMEEGYSWFAHSTFVRSARRILRDPFFFPIIVGFEKKSRHTN